MYCEHNVRASMVWLQSGTECPTHGDAKCTSCESGYSLENMICVEKQCNCEHGVNATGTDCPTDGLRNAQVAKMDTTSKVVSLSRQHTLLCGSGLAVEESDCEAAFTAMGTGCNKGYWDHSRTRMLHCCGEDNAKARLSPELPSTSTCRI